MTAPAETSPHPGMGFKQFTALIAMMMALNALAIDSMLPALPQIGDALGIDTENHRQWIVTAYLLGFGSAPLVYGVLADRFGRRRVLLVGICIYVVASLVAGFAGSFQAMMIARFTQGVGAAATRVLSIAIIRDCYAGRRMAKVMSLVFIVFLAVPILAPTVGQAIITIAPWRWIFGFLGLFGAVVLTWAALRLPETLHPEDRLPIDFGRIRHAFALTLTSRVAVGYMLAVACMIGGLMGFINSAQQIFVDIFHQQKRFPVIFALVAVAMAFSSLTNSRIVEKIGMRRVSHTAVIGVIVFSAIHAGVALAGIETLWTFVGLQSLTMYCFGMVGPNFNTMAMEPLGHVAGVGASVQGTVTTIGGALIGFLIGQNFNGTTVPLTIGFTLCGTTALLLVLFTEKGRLFHAGAAS